MYYQDYTYLQEVCKREPQNIYNFIGPYNTIGFNKRNQERKMMGKDKTMVDCIY